MQGSTLEARVTFAVERLLSDSAEVRRAVVRDMARAWPDAPALALVLALTDAAARIESVFRQVQNGEIGAQLGYRHAALVACDVLVLQCNGPGTVLAKDLLVHWHAHDDFFLR
ncbi:MAG: hypothetical protein ACE368_18560 [Paracoccaceae bacterium]